MALESIKYKRGSCSILNQLLLPHSKSYEEISSLDEGWTAINTMMVRGAPSIAIVGCLSLAVELTNKEFISTQEMYDFVCKSLDYLITARPTAVNIFKEAKKIKEYSALLLEDELITVEEMKLKIIVEIEALEINDREDNTSIGKFGAEHILNNKACKHDNDKVVLLTHCNTGSLATSGYGTALGVIRRLHDIHDNFEAYFTETRPYNQGSRLTAFEMVHDNINATLIADSMVSLLMKEKTISAVVVGADRVARNGDTANKIGTYQIAICAKYHNIPFYVAAPYSSVDHNIETGDNIVIEQRPPEELTHIGGVRVAAHGINCWNPAFDVTPAELITGGIITEKGVFKASQVCATKHHCVPTKDKHENGDGDGLQMIL